MGTKKPYERPVLQAYGDIRAVTRGVKKFGGGDSMLMFLTQNPTCYEPAGDCDGSS